jgi:hypothetical protein
VYGSPTPGPPVGPWGLIINYPTLSYKGSGGHHFRGVKKKKRLRQGRLEHNITQFSRRRRVLRSGGLNHLNHRVHRVHLELTTKRLKTFPTKKNTAGCSCSSSGENVAKPLRHIPYPLLADFIGSTLCQTKSQIFHLCYKTGYESFFSSSSLQLK